MYDNLCDMSKEETVVKKEGADSFVVYEVGYLLLPTLPEEQLEGVVSSIKEIVVEKKGSVIAEDFPAMRALAYTMPKIIATKRQKFDHAYFGWVKFEVESSEISSIKKNIEALDAVLRALFIKTVRESTLMAGKVHAQDAEKAKQEGTAVDSGEVKPEQNVEEIDKSIDALVIS